jgi:two-component system alkaline phosphatase synthesis response regulator PhoP
MSKRRILLIEDEPGLQLTLTDRLTVQGFEVETAGDGRKGLELARAGGWDLILLDVMLPGMNGFEVLAMLRKGNIATPVLLLTARGQLADKLHGLNLGADDYLVKPFEVLELLARMEALLRRAPAAPQANVVEFGAARVDLRAGVATLCGKEVPLTAKEFQLLEYLARHRGMIVTREQLLRDVWGLTYIPSTRTVDVHMTWLRQKLEEDPKHPRHFITIRGSGYRFQ